MSAWERFASSSDGPLERSVFYFDGGAQPLYGSLYRGSGGRVLVAFDDALMKSVPAEDLAFYARIVQQGFYAATGDRLAEVAGISAPVFRHERQIAGALTLTMPVHRYKEKYIGQLVSAARDLSARIA